MKPGHSVLLVDDDKQLVKLLKSNLQEQGLHCAIVVLTAAMGVSMAQRYRPDLILLDVSMPYVDGLQAFQKLRADVKTAQIPVIFISEMMSQVIYPLVARSPRAAHLKKPLDLVDLNSLLRQFLQRYAPLPAA